MESCNVPPGDPYPGAMVASLIRLLTIQASYSSPERASLITRQLVWLADRENICPALRQVSEELSDFWGSVVAATMPVPTRR